MASLIPTIDFGALAASIVSPITNYINNGLSTVENLVAGVASTISNDIKATISSVGDAVGAAETAIASDVKESVGAVEKGVSTAIQGVATTIGGALNEVETAIGHAITAVGQDIEAGMQLVVQPIEHVAAAIVTDIGNGLGAIDRELVSFVQSVEDVAVAVGGELAKIPDVLLQILNAPTEAITAVAEMAYQDRGSLTQGFLDGHHTSVGWLMALAKAPAADLSR